LPNLSASQFPSLPPVSGTALEVRQLFNSKRESSATDSAWSRGTSQVGSGGAAEEEEGVNAVQGKGKKKKGKEKQMLFSIGGTFPT
jgi:hypothetical protein